MRKLIFALAGLTMAATAAPAIAMKHPPYYGGGSTSGGSTSGGSSSGGSTPVPEPGALAMMATGLIGFAAVSRLRRRQK